MVNFLKIMDASFSIACSCGTTSFSFRNQYTFIIHINCEYTSGNDTVPYHCPWDVLTGIPEPAKVNSLAVLKNKLLLVNE